MQHYGKELILDLHDCDPRTFNRTSISKYFKKLCKYIKMKPEDMHFWDFLGDKKAYDRAPDHIKGTSAIQFIKTSNITIHTLDVLKKVYLNIFSCKDFDEQTAINFSCCWFKGKAIHVRVVKRV